MIAGLDALGDGGVGDEDVDAGVLLFDEEDGGGDGGIGGDVDLDGFEGGGG